MTEWQEQHSSRRKKFDWNKVHLSESNQWTDIKPVNQLVSQYKLTFKDSKN